MKSRNQRDIQPVGHIATGFIQTIFFDMGFNYIGARVEQVSIFPDAPDDWESESCKEIPYVRYEYTQVCKNNPETSRSPMTRINLARKKVKFFASAAKEKGSVLRIVKNTHVIKLHPNVNANVEITFHYLEESYGSLISDPIASERKTREMPPDLKEKAKAASKKNVSKLNVRRVK
jgi:hypothetical protein